MTVIVLIAVSDGLRGHLTRWMVEVSAGVFVGNLNPRIRDILWKTITSKVANGQAVIINQSRNEQGWTMRSVGAERWHPVDFDGLILSGRKRL